jgi:excisionase family DNA binding protein
VSDQVDTRALAEEVAALISKPTPALMTAEEAAAFLNVPVSWVRAQARAKRIPVVQLGRYTRFDPDELAAWRRARRAGPSANGRPKGGRP